MIDTSRESVDLRTILLIEDEEGEVQKEMQRLLENLGYNVLVATNERSSDEILSQANSKVDLIIVNQRMASDDVLALGRRIREKENVATTAPLLVIPFESNDQNEGKDVKVGALMVIGFAML